MIFNLYDVFTLKVEGVSDKADVIIKEFEPFKIDKRTRPSSIDLTIIFTKNQSRQSAKMLSKITMIKEPVAFDKKGFFLYDKNNYICRFDLRESFLNGYTIYPEDGFNSALLTVIIDSFIGIKIIQNNLSYVHSSGFSYQTHNAAQAVLCPAWRNSGKTNTLLSALRLGYKYITDDWVMVSNDGKIFPSRRRLNLLYYNFTFMPNLLEYTSSEIQGLYGLITNAIHGKHDFDEDVITSLKQIVKVRVPVAAIKDFQEEHLPLNIKAVVHLKKYIAPRDEKSTLTAMPINKARLAAQMMSTALFENRFMLLAHQAFQATTGLANHDFTFFETNLLSSYETMLHQIEHLYEIPISSQDQAIEAFDVIHKLRQSFK